MAGTRKKPKKTAYLERRGTQWWIVASDGKETDAGRNEKYAAALMRDLYPE